jgi:hypothetical protein
MALEKGDELVIEINFNEGPLSDTKMFSFTERIKNVDETIQDIYVIELEGGYTLNIDKNRYDKINENGGIVFEYTWSPTLLSYI